MNNDILNSDIFDKPEFSDYCDKIVSMMENSPSLWNALVATCKEHNVTENSSFGLISASMVSGQVVVLRKVTAVFSPTASSGIARTCARLGQKISKNSKKFLTKIQISDIMWSHEQDTLKT